MGTKERRKRREQNRAEHLRIVDEAEQTYRAYFDTWEVDGERYRRIVGASMQGRADVQPTYRKQSNRPLTPLTVDDLAVALKAVDGYGTSSGGLSIRRLLLAFNLCGIGRQRAKASASLRALTTLALIEQIGNYSKGKRGNQYRLAETTWRALGRGDRPLLSLLPKPIRPLPNNPIVVNDDRQGVNGDDDPFA